MRARDLFYALWISDLFMERVKGNKLWSLFSPDSCPGLENAWGDEYKNLYEKYESESKGIKILKARDVWFKILDSQIEKMVWPNLDLVPHFDGVSKVKHHPNLCSDLNIALTTGNRNSVVYQLRKLEQKILNKWPEDKTLASFFTGFLKQYDLEKAVNKANRKQDREKKKQENERRIATKIANLNMFTSSIFFPTHISNKLLDKVAIA